jgi:hypothetical protein
LLLWSLHFGGFQQPGVVDMFVGEMEVKEQQKWVEKITELQREI